MISTRIGLNIRTQFKFSNISLDISRCHLNYWYNRTFAILIVLTCLVQPWNVIPSYNHS